MANQGIQDCNLITAITLYGTQISIAHIYISIKTPDIVNKIQPHCRMCSLMGDTAGRHF